MTDQLGYTQEHVTDRDILKMYQERIVCEPNTERRRVAGVEMAVDLLFIARGDDWMQPVNRARDTLARIGERAAPLHDEGAPCEIGGA